MNGLRPLQLLQNKLHYESGETIAETLVSILISSLALLLLSTAIGTAVNVVSRSKTAMETHYAQESSLAEGNELTPAPVEASVNLFVSPYTGGTSTRSVVVYTAGDNNIYRYMESIP